MTGVVETIIDSHELAGLIAGRQKEIHSFPKNFRKHSTFFSDYYSTIFQPVTFYDRTPRKNQPLSITLAPQQGEHPIISVAENSQVQKKQAILSKNITLGKHNIRVGDIQFCEHYLSLLSIFNLQLDCHLSHSTFPLSTEMLGNFINTLQDQPLKKLGRVTKYTINKPFALKFATSPGYLLLLPADQLTLDHQIDYPGSSVGQQRIQLLLDQECFNYVARARTNLFTSESILRFIFFLQKKGGIPFFWSGIKKEDILFASPNRLHNRKKSFDSGDINFEFIAHEIIDILCWLKIVEIHFNCKLIVKMISHRFGHREQIATAQWFCAPDSLFNTQIGFQKI